MVLETIVTTVHLAVLGLVALYGVHRVSLLARFRWRPDAPEAARSRPLPSVTVQLPVFNERTVAARLVRAAGELDYPPDLLEIQVLDDSLDETRAIVDEEVARLVARGLRASVVRRPDRRGFKAGALAHGMQSARGELIAIFDADFVPPADFLRRLVGRFEDPRVGLVQARWEHMNREASRLTRAAATLLDGHFVIEHKVRYDSGVFFNFNGTAGIWRRTAIDDAGGWQHDTLTEDLDLSYRAQLRGWKFVYAAHVTAPAEVPPDVAAFKSQQHRWAKGSVQVLRKLGGRLARAPIPWRTKLEAFAHLTGNVGHPCVLVLALTLPLWSTLRPDVAPTLNALSFFLCTISVVGFYEASQRALGRPLLARLADVLAGLALGIGMCVSQTRAVLTGLRRETGEFVRTPKVGDAPPAKRYRGRWSGWQGIELLLAGWQGAGLVVAVRDGAWGSLPFLGLFGAGFLWVGASSLAGAARAWGARRAGEDPVREAPSLKPIRPVAP